MKKQLLILCVVTLTGGSLYFWHANTLKSMTKTLSQENIGEDIKQITESIEKLNIQEKIDSQVKKIKEGLDEVENMKNNFDKNIEFYKKNKDAYIDYTNILLKKNREILKSQEELNDLINKNYEDIQLVLKKIIPPSSN